MTAPTALLALEDGTVFRGSGFGAEGEAFGEAVFNTGMTGYQEVLTDPSYTGQIVTMTAPQQGNYGMHAADAESERIHVAGFAVREASRRASSPRADGTLGEGLDAAGVIGIEGIDTRKLTLRIRDAGAMRAAISTEDLEPTSLVDRVRESPGMAGADLARTVTTSEPYDAGAIVGPADTSRGRVLRIAVTTSGSSGTSFACWRPPAWRPRSSPRRRPPATSSPAASTACSCRTDRATRRRPRTGSRPRPSCSGGSRSSGSASDTSCSASRSEDAPTRCRSVIGA